MTGWQIRKRVCPHVHRDEQQGILALVDPSGITRAWFMSIKGRHNQYMVVNAIHSRLLFNASARRMTSLWPECAGDTLDMGESQAGGVMVTVGRRDMLSLAFVMNQWGWL